MLVGRALTAVLVDIGLEGLDLLAIIGQLHGLEVLLVGALGRRQARESEHQGHSSDHLPFHA
jgi:hypothetical protein